MDIHYKEVTGSSVDVAAKTYKFCGMTRDNQVLENSHHREKAHPIHKPGAVKYNRVDYQLTPGLINENFVAYLEFLKIAFPEEKIV